MMQTRKRKKSDTQRVPVVRRHSPVFGITTSSMMIAKPFSSHEVSISSLGRFVNPVKQILFNKVNTGPFLFVNILQKEDDIMTIIRKRINNPRRYLFALQPGDEFYIAASLTEGDTQRLRHYGIKPDGEAKIPIPRRSATIANADGRWIVHRN